MDHYTAEELALTQTEGFPCPEADRLEDLAARLGSFRDELGLTALQLRTKARMRFNFHQGKARKQTQERPQAGTRERLVG